MGRSNPEIDITQLNNYMEEKMISTQLATDIRHHVEKYVHTHSMFSVGKIHEMMPPRLRKLAILHVSILMPGKKIKITRSINII